MEYPNNLRRLRDAMRLTQEQVAGELGINQAEYSRMEKGRRRVGTHLETLCKILKCEEGAILTFDQYQPMLAQPTHGVTVYARPLKYGGDAIRFDYPMESKALNPNFESGSDEIFCVFAYGDKNLPRLKHGDMLFCDPKKTPIDGDICAIHPKSNKETGLLRIFDSKLNLFITQQDMAIGQRDNTIDKSDVTIFGVAIGLEFSRNS